jgi:ComF family protein
MRLFSYFTDFLFPKDRKIVELEALSPGKLAELLPRSELGAGSDAFALFDYSHPVAKSVIWEIKYGGNRVLAEKLGVLLYDAVMAEALERNIFERFKTLILMPVPVSDKRRFERGWNQAELLAEAVKRCDRSNGFKYLPRQLAKIRHTESQTKTSGKAERLQNLKESMRVLNPESVRERCVVLIDDVTTTGATFAEARRALKEAGAKRVLCFAVAH